MRQSILAMEKHEVFDLVEALYTFAILNHSGLHSDLYRLQCEIGNHYTAGYGFSESDVEENNEFYNEIDESNVQNIWNRVEYYLENRWED